MNIGDASFRSGVSAKMIRYYEQIGLIPQAKRTGSGYRDYADADIHMLRFIARARDLGFSVSEITDLLDLWRDTGRRSADVKALAQARLCDLRQKIAHLQDMAETLEDLAQSCAGNDRPDCPILRNLEAPTPGAPDIEPESAPTTTKGSHRDQQAYAHRRVRGSGSCPGNSRSGRHARSK